MRFLLLILCLAFCGCEREEPLIREEAVAEIAVNMGKAEVDRFLEREMEMAITHAEYCLKRLERATTHPEIELAAEDLRLANNEVARVEKKISENK